MDQETNQRSVLNTLMSPAASMTADATIAIIAEEGFDQVSVHSMAARLGVAPGTVQYRSPSRRTLLTDALVHNGAYPARDDTLRFEVLKSKVARVTAAQKGTTLISEIGRAHV